VRVLYFGTYERDYPRNVETIACLRQAGVEVTEWHSPVWETQRHKYAAGVFSALRFARAEARLLRRPKVDFDVMIVGYPGQLDMPLARRIAGKRPLVFNPATSMYDALVLDRGRWKTTALPARVLKKIDVHAFRIADLVVAESEENARFLAQYAELDRSKIAVCFLGAEEPLFHPGRSPAHPFHCLYHGKLIPHHGVDTVLAAARLAPDLRFRIVGAGQLDPLLDRGLPPNVERTGWIERSRIPGELWSAGCSLGVFGTNDRVGRVITNKTFEALACGTPLVTADTPAARELLVDGESALLIRAGDPAALAAAVRRIATDPALAERLSHGGRAAYDRHASRAVLGARWTSILEELVAG
jgi:glycosyltransferase involved in cell wall biosynthesis